ncbi:MAG: PEP-CTERM sorting domain-containing protein [Planctomycetes bacterium]|nr:PEP-CTERM sorting domain-containing protein [Planctomycetota bacterium]
MSIFLRPRCVFNCLHCNNYFRQVHRVLIAGAIAFSLVANLATSHAGVFGLQNVASGLDSPIYATYAPGDTDRLFIVERGGAVRILDLNTGTMNAQNFLQVPDVDAAFEGGLLSLAFHPDYANNGKFYVNVTVDNGGIFLDGGASPFSSRIREYTVSANPDIANPTATEVVSWVQPRANHNGGWIGFSPVDNYLYITSGDGGKQGDPDNNAQTLDEVNPGQTFGGEPLGKILRLDVDGDDFPGDATRNYAVPNTNPYVGVANATDEIWASGLRNPWQASFDRVTGDFWIGDVGQNNREEINFQDASSTGGENYGWQRREGLFPYQGGVLLPTDTEPVYDYGHGSGTFQGNSVVGGVVYRGPDPTLQGTYFFADTISSNFWTFDSTNPAATVANINSDLGAGVGFPVSFGEDAVGNVYVVDLGGNVFRILTDTLVVGDFDANGAVDLSDLDRWEANFSTTGGAIFSDGDADEDGDVDGLDFLAWQQNYGGSAQSPAVAAGTAVPEPSSLGLFMLGLLAFVGRPRGRAAG